MKSLPFDTKEESTNILRRMEGKSRYQAPRHLGVVHEMDLLPVLRFLNPGGMDSGASSQPTEKTNSGTPVWVVG